MRCDRSRRGWPARPGEPCFQTEPSLRAGDHACGCARRCGHGREHRPLHIRMSHTWLYLQGSQTQVSAAFDSQRPAPTSGAAVHEVTHLANAPAGGTTTGRGHNFDVQDRSFAHRPLRDRGEAEPQRFEFHSGECAEDHIHLHHMGDSMARRLIDGSLHQGAGDGKFMQWGRASKALEPSAGAPSMVPLHHLRVRLSVRRG
jgi:hypothetical protein